MEELPELTIGEVARRAGVATSSIRYYERIELLPTAERVSGQRRYRPEVLGIEVATECGCASPAECALFPEGPADPGLALELVTAAGKDCRRAPRG